MIRETMETPGQKPSFILLAALACYVTLAFAGIRYGLPTADHAMSYNCDEGWLEFISNMKPAEHKFNPAPRFGHPTLYLFSYAASLFAASKIGYVPLNQNKEWYRQHPEILGRLYLVGRYMQVVCGVLLLIGGWYISKIIFNRNVANIATALLAVCPSMIATSHFSQANLPVALLTNIALACLLLGAKEENPSVRWLYGSALAMGLAISTKLSALAFAAPLAYYAIRFHRQWPGIIKIALVAVCLVVAGFIFGTPFSVLSPHTFWPAFIRHGQDNQEPFSSVGTALVFLFQAPYNHALGTPLLALTLIGIGSAIVRKKNTARWLLLIWVGAFFWATIRVGVITAPARILIVLPAWILLGALFIDDLETRVGHAPWISTATLVILIPLTMLPSLAIVARRRATPIQKLSSDWLKANVAYDQTIGLPREDFWWSPDIIRQSTSHPERLAHTYHVEVLDYSVDRAKELKPDYIVASANEKLRCFGKPATCPEFAAWLDSGADYRLVKQFPRDLTFLGWRWNRPESPKYPEYHDDDLFETALFIYKRNA